MDVRTIPELIVITARAVESKDSLDFVREGMK